MLYQRLCGRFCVGAAGADSGNAAVRLDHIACSRQDKRVLLVRNQEKRLQPPQQAVGPPVFCQLDGGPGNIAVVLFELLLEALKKGKRIGRRPGEACETSVLIEFPYLFRRMLQDGVLKRDLPVSGEYDPVFVSDA